MAIRQKSRRPQKAKRNVQGARERNVFGVRRPIHPESYPVFDKVNKKMDVEIGGSGRLFVPNALTITVVGFTRFTKDHILRGPSTFDILDKVESSDSKVSGKLGSLAVFGAGNKYKLGFYLHSPEVMEEIDTCETAYRDAGYPLRADRNAPHGSTPHCSVALMFGDNVEHFKESRTLARLNDVANVLGRTVVLGGVKLPDTIS